MLGIRAFLCSYVCERRLMDRPRCPPHITAYYLILPHITSHAHPLFTNVPFMQVPCPYDSSHSFNMSHLYNISHSWMCPTHMTFRTHNCERFPVCSAHVTHHTCIISHTHECVLPTWHLALMNESVSLYALPMWHVTLMWHVKLVKVPYPYLLWCGAWTVLHVLCMCCVCFCHARSTRRVIQGLSRRVIQGLSKRCRGALEDALLYGMRFCISLRFKYIYSNTYIRICPYIFIDSARKTRPSLAGELVEICGGYGQ